MRDTFVAQSLIDLGDEWRQDWSAFDGRSARDELHSLASYLSDGDAVDNVIRQVLIEYGTALRGDWSGFDGRVAKSELHGLAAELLGRTEPRTVEQHRESLTLCPDGNEHWSGPWGHCQLDTCPTFAAEQEADRG